MRYIHNNPPLSSLQNFGNVTGVTNQDSRNIYFVRALGANVDYVEEINRLDNTLLQSMREGKLLYKRIKALPNMPLGGDADFYAGCYSRWTDSQRAQIKTKTADQSAQLSGALGRALSETIEQYRKIKAGMSETIERNFAVKLLYWFDFVMQDILTHWDENCIIRVAAQNVTKEQEYLFYYMITRIGADVLLLQSKADIETKQSLKELSAQLTLGTYTDVEIPDFSPMQSTPQKQQTTTAGNPSQPVSIARNRTQTQETVATDSPNIRVVIPRRADRRETVNPAVVTNIPSRAPQSTNANRNPVISANRNSGTNVNPNVERREKSFEELAQLASSVVMIAIHDDKGKIIGSGSGIMIGKGGYILTNNHVACGGSFYTVKIEEDDNHYTTDQVIKYNPVLDLAVIRIDRPLNPLRIYNGPQKLVRGQKVVAIGSPLGLFNSVSDGIISGFRKIDDVDMIQFTAPISHGSSGGAVLNMYGEVIGISTAGFDDGQNINLAVGYEFINMFVRGFVSP